MRILCRAVLLISSSSSSRIMSPVDGKSLEGVPSVKMQQEAEFESDGKLVKCTEVCKRTRGLYEVLTLRVTHECPECLPKDCCNCQNGTNRHSPSIRL